MPWYSGPTPIQKEFSRRIARQWLIAVPFAVGLPLLPVCIEALHSAGPSRIRTIFMILICLLVPTEAALFGFALWNWRCPSCRRLLGQNANPRVCNHCGAALSREEYPETRNPFWTLLHLSLKALRAAHKILHGLAFMAFGACLGGIGGVRLAEHAAPRDETALIIMGAAIGFIAGGLIARSALRHR